MSNIMNVLPIEEKTDHKNLQQDDRFRKALQLSGLGYWEMDPTNNLFYSSDKLFDIYGV